jgi:ATP-dependent DNA ligase
MPPYIYPPRPKSKIHPDLLQKEEDRGVWLWQRKYDGDRCVVVVENGRVHLANRRGGFHSPTKFAPLRRELSALKFPSGIHYLDGELLHPLVPNTIVLFDVLQLGRYLLGENQLDRLSLLANLCGNPYQDCPFGVATQVSQNVWLAQGGDQHFVKEFGRFLDSRFGPDGGLVTETTPGRLVEGLVLRRKDSVLDSYGARPYEVDWQLRCRIGNKNYRF